MVSFGRRRAPLGPRRRGPGAARHDLSQVGETTRAGTHAAALAQGQQDRGRAERGCEDGDLAVAGRPPDRHRRHAEASGRGCHGRAAVLPVPQAPRAHWPGYKAKRRFQDARELRAPRGLAPVRPRRAKIEHEAGGRTDLRQDAHGQADHAQCAAFGHNPRIEAESPVEGGHPARPDAPDLSGPAARGPQYGQGLRHRRRVGAASRAPAPRRHVRAIVGAARHAQDALGRLAHGRARNDVERREPQRRRRARDAARRPGLERRRRRRRRLERRRRRRRRRAPARRGGRRVHRAPPRPRPRRAAAAH
mmetsp:Transcript_20484/g.61220  ORF Transcript_20484/g.61220 Transcript_20484/m.61220 type:complete len:306 (-) Transcript_20484:973-1890(-)